MPRTLTSRDHRRLVEIKDEIKDLLEQAERLIRATGLPYDRARAYWLAAIKMNLDNEHDFLGSSMNTMQETIDELDPGDYDDDDENYDD